MNPDDYIKGPTGWMDALQPGDTILTATGAEPRGSGLRRATLKEATITKITAKQIKAQPLTNPTAPTNVPTFTWNRETDRPIGDTPAAYPDTEHNREVERQNTAFNETEWQRP